MKYCSRLFLLLCLVLLPFHAIAQSLIDYTIKPSKGSPRTSFHLVISSQGNATVPELVDEGDFNVRYVGPESQVSIFNGSMTQEKKFNYQATPKKEGTLSLPKFTLTVDGQSVTTPPRTVVVSAASLDTQQAEEDDVRVEDHLLKTTLYQGEQTLVTTELMTISPLQNIQIEKQTHPNVWVEEIKPDSREQDMRRGALVSILKFRNVVFPLHDGAQSIEPTVISAQVSRSKVGDLFDRIDPFNNNFMRGLFAFDLEPLTLATKATPLTVLALPPLPAELSSTLPILTGKTSVSATIDKETTDPNDEAILTVLIRTEGNGNLLQDLSLDGNDEYELVRDSQSLKKSFSNNILLFEYTAQFRVIPKKNGLISLMPVELVYFDPALKTYAKTSSTPLIVNGNHVIEKAATPTPIVDEEEVPADRRVGLLPEDVTPPSPLPWVSVIFLSVAVGVALLAFLIVPKIGKKPKRLDDISTLPLPSDDPKVFLAQLSQLIQERNKSEVSVHGYIKSKFFRDPGKVTDLHTCLKVVEEAAYAPQAAVSTELFRSARDTLWQGLTTYGN